MPARAFPSPPMPRGPRPGALLLVRALVPLLVLLLGATAAVAGPADDARAAMKARRWEDAAASWREVLAKKPRDPEAAVGLARAGVEGGLVDARGDSFSDAEDALLTIVEKEPGHRDARLALGDFYLALAASKTDDQNKKFTYEDARGHFEPLVEANPSDEQAVVGLARYQFAIGDFDGAIRTIDAFLAKAKSQGLALYWKGQVLYLQARDAYAAAGQVDDAARALFQKALGSFESAAAADPEKPEIVLHVAYAAQFLGETERARAAYEKAIALDPTDPLPIRGIEALYTHEPDERGKALQRIAREHPTCVPVHYHLGRWHLERSEWDAAVKALRAYVAKARWPGDALALIGYALERKGDLTEAWDAYRKALEADPDDEYAAGQMDQLLQRKVAQGQAADPDKMLAFAKEYEALFALAPRNPWVRNNAAFILRGAIDQAGRTGIGPWKPVLDRCVAMYLDAARIVEQRVERGTTGLGWAAQYGYASILNDTGLMLQYYPPVRDLARAETFYLAALDVSEDGHKDATDNLRKVWEEQGRWQEAYELLAIAAEALLDEAGDHESRETKALRAWARSLMRGYVESGKAKAE